MGEQEGESSLADAAVPPQDAKGRRARATLKKNPRGATPAGVQPVLCGACIDTHVARYSRGCG
eukprot:scaffold115467_cov21-Phaeocystis_antarctica.AAC.1